jgi:hypothetical protein
MRDTCAEKGINTHQISDQISTIHSTPLELEELLVYNVQ